MNRYHTFLGLPESTIAPDHYELLGISRFVADAELIHRTLIAKSTQLRKWDNSRWFREADALLDEVIAAGLILEDPVRKAEYDRRLLLESAEQTSISVCPECLEERLAESDLDRAVIIDTAGNIESEVVSVHRVCLHGIWDGIEISNWMGKSPPWVLTRAGAMALVAVVWLVPTAVFGLLGASGFGSAWQFVWTGLAVFIPMMLVVAALYRPRQTTPINVAWQLIVPEYLEIWQADSLDHSDFVAGLARVSSGRGDRMLRAPIVRRAIDWMGPLVRRGVIPDHCLSELLRLNWDDASRANRGQSSGGAVLRRMLQQTLSRQIPLKSVDFATSEGVTLSRLQDDESIELVWSLVADVMSVGLTPSDLVELASRSSTIRELLNRANVPSLALPYFFAIINLEESGALPDGLSAARKVLQSGHDTLVRPTLLAQTSHRTDLADAMQLTAEGLVFRGRLFPFPVEVSLIPQMEFVQTGWTHQRKNGQRDRRFANNPPIGYQRTVGYSLFVGEVSWYYSYNPKSLANRVRSVMIFQFDLLESAAADYSEKPVSKWLPQITDDPASRCPNCSRRLPDHAGGVARRVPRETELDGASQRAPSMRSIRRLRR